MMVNRFNSMLGGPIADFKLIVFGLGRVGVSDKADHADALQGYIGATRSRAVSPRRVKALSAGAPELSVHSL